MDIKKKTTLIVDVFLSMIAMLALEVDLELNLFMKSKQGTRKNGSRPIWR